MYFEFTADELRSIIEGNTTYKRCPSCNGKGVEYYSTTTGEVITEEKYNETEKYETDVCACDLCFGVGYIKAFIS